MKKLLLSNLGLDKSYILSMDEKRKTTGGGGFCAYPLCEHYINDPNNYDVFGYAFCIEKKIWIGPV